MSGAKVLVKEMRDRHGATISQAVVRVLGQVWMQGPKAPTTREAIAYLGHYTARRMARKICYPYHYAGGDEDEEHCPANEGYYDFEEDEWEGA